MKIKLLVAIIVFCTDLLGQSVEINRHYQYPVDTMPISIVFRGDFNHNEKYYLFLVKDSLSKTVLPITGGKGYSYHYFSGQDSFLKNENLDIKLKLYWKIRNTYHEMVIRIPQKDSSKSILYFEKKRHPLTASPFDVIWINKADLKSINWIDYCISKNFYNSEIIKFKCLKL